MSHGHGHDDHHDEHDEHDTHGHDAHHEEHSPHDHSGHHDDYGDHYGAEHSPDDFDDSQDELDESEEIQYSKLIDLTQTTYAELEDLDMSVIQKPLPLQPYKALFKKNTLDISPKELHKINLSLEPRIKILALKRPIQDIIVAKKTSNVFLVSNEKKDFKYLLSLKDIDSLSRENGPYFDIIPPKRSVIKKVGNIVAQMKTISKKIPKDIPISGGYSFDVKVFLQNFSQKLSFIKKTKNIALLFLILCLISFYGVFTKYYVEKSFHKLQNLTLSSDISLLQSQIVDLKTSFIITQILLKPIFVGNIFFNNENISNLEHATSGVFYGINYVIDMLTIYDGIHNLTKQKKPNEILLSELYKNILPILSQANGSLDKSVGAFSLVENLPNPEIQKSLDTKLGMLKKLQGYSHLLYEKKDAILELLGDEKKKTYMVVFQNADEIRPTGGFMGSLAFIQMYKGKVLNFEKKDIYALEWNIKDTFNEPPPPGLSSITNAFTLRDANFYPSIQESSEKIKSFVDRTQYHIDGIVYINQNIIIDFLKKFGGVYYETVKREVTGDNFSMLMSTLVESKVSKTHTLATPKQVLFDFIDIYIHHLQKLGNYSGYVNSLLSSFEKKDIFIHIFDKEINQLLSDIIKSTHDFETTLDFNYPVFTSISGNKSDRYIQREFIKTITEQSDCSIQTNLTLKQYHNFGITQEIEIKNFLYDVDLLGRVDLENTLQIQGKGLNKQFVRVLLPKEAIVDEDKKIQVKDFDTHKEVSFYMETNTFFPSEKKISYTIQNQNCKPYAFEFIKQPGIPDYKLSLTKNDVTLFDSFLSKDYVLK